MSWLEKLGYIIAGFIVLEMVAISDNNNYIY